MNPCETKDCSGVVAAVAMWPGRPMRLCRACALRMAGVAKAMGFEVAVIWLPEGSPE